MVDFVSVFRVDMHSQPTKYYHMLNMSSLVLFDIPIIAANPNQREIVFGKIKNDKLIETTFLVEVTVTATKAPKSLIKANTKIRPKLSLTLQSFIPM